MSRKRKNKEKLIQNQINQTIGACYMDMDAYEPVSVSSNPNMDEIKWVIVVGLIGLCGCLATIFGIMDNSRMNYDAPGVVIKLIFFTIICCVLICFLKEKRNIAYSIISVYLVLRAYSNWEFLKKGMLRLADNVASQIDNNYSGVETFEKSASKHQLVGDALVLFGMIWIFVFLFINRKKIEVGISYLFMLPFVIGILIISVYLSMHFLILLGIYLFILLVSSNGNDGRKIVAKRVSFNTIICGIPCILIIVLLVNMLVPKGLHNPEKIQTIKNDVSHRIEEFAKVKLTGGHKQAFDVNDVFNGGNIAFNTDPKIGNVSELKLTKKPELEMNIFYDGINKFGNRLYLKGKAYDTYNNNGWQNTLYEPEDSIVDSNIDEYYTSKFPMYFNSMAGVVEKVDKNSISGMIEITDKFNRATRFHPYYIEPDFDTSYADEIMDSGRVISELSDYYESGNYSAYRHKFISQDNQTSFYKQAKYIKKNIAEHFATEESIDSADYQSAYRYESDNIFMENNMDIPGFTDIPRFYNEFETMEVDVDGEKIDLVGRGYDKEIGIEPYVDYVLNYFSNYKYDLKPGKTPDDMDSVDYFIMKKKGYCMYYATTATLMFRKMGIAARYVEGYAVDLPSSYEGNKIIEVKNNDSHAWTEIFIPNVGWIPIEVTVGSGSGYTQNETKQETTTENKSTNRNETTTKKQLTTKKNNQPTTKQATTKKVEEKTHKVSAQAVVRVILTIITALVIIILLAIVIRFLLKYLLKKYFYTFAYFTIDRYEVDLIKLCKIKNINITENYDRNNSISRIIKEFGVNESLVKQVYALIDRAKYSKNADISSEERKKLYKLISKIAHKINQEGNMITKLKVALLMLRYK